MRRIGAWTAVGVLLAADAVLLVGVAANRRGGPEATLRLTERELWMPGRTEENSALALVLRWHGARPELDAGKLAALGFDTRSHRTASKEVFAVLELEAAAPENESRLKIVDVGRDFAALRSRYPDRSRFALLPAVVRAVGTRGWMTTPYVSIYVPPEYLPVFRGLRLASLSVSQPRYEVTLCFGRRGEPWICGARAGSQ